jgi:hypothetical protein
MCEDALTLTFSQSAAPVFAKAGRSPANGREVCILLATAGKCGALAIYEHKATEHEPSQAVHPARTVLSPCSIYAIQSPINIML